MSHKRFRTRKIASIIYNIILILILSIVESIYRPVFLILYGFSCVNKASIDHSSYSARRIGLSRFVDVMASKASLLVCIRDSLQTWTVAFTYVSRSQCHNPRTAVERRSPLAVPASRTDYLLLINAAAKKFPITGSQNGNTDPTSGKYHCFAMNNRPIAHASKSCRWWLHCRF